MTVTQQTYDRLVLADPEGPWELHNGEPREKPPMAAEHNDLVFELGHQLRLQLDRDAFRVRVNAGRLRRPVKTTYIPDVAVIPAAIERTQRHGRPGFLEVYEEPLPLVVEVWSPSTGDYDVDAKFPEYRRRGDREIWRIHPFERSLIVWRRQSDGSYTEESFGGGTIEPIALPGVGIDLDALFAELP